jgi:hypothetical protein
MHLLDRIETQLVSNRLPLVAVSVAAVPHANTPVVLTLHWHGFVETKLADVTDANVVAYQPVPSSALQLNERWDRLDDLENDVLDVAWQLGAWDCARTEALPFIRPGGSEQESFECMGAFGAPPVLLEGQPPGGGRGARRGRPYRGGGPWRLPAVGLSPRARWRMGGRKRR